MSEQSWAREVQLESGPADDVLTGMAMAGTPRARHWWGRRHWFEDATPATSDDRVHVLGQRTGRRLITGAWCYVCGAPIATWARRFKITEAARRAVDDHRAEHVRMLVAATLNREENR